MQAPILFQGDAATFALTDGLQFQVTSTTVEPARDASIPIAVEDAQRLGPVWALQRHLRKRIVLHASAHIIDDAVVCVAAFPGTGKSTLSTQLRKQGAGFLSDDLASIGEDLQVEKGPPHVRLWPDTRDWAGIKDPSLRKLLPDYDKQIMDLEPVADEAPLGAVFFLQRGDEAQVERLRPAQGVVELTRYTYLYHMYRPRCPDWPEDRWHFRLASKIADQVPLYRLTVKEGLENVEDAAQQVRATVTA